MSQPDGQEACRNHCIGMIADVEKAFNRKGRKSSREERNDTLD